MLIAKTQELAERRVSKGWTKSDLANEADLPRSVVVRAEQGKSVAPGTAKAIADAFGAKVTDLFSVRLKKEGS